ncbi:MAG: 3-dehydro-L-gulonate 2-dehydrogenase, partial [Spirochaetales bacterium]|nr:3-dehydro-L-gulonate 2-dehydrogenase [Spirochaetales bacterium]
INHNELYETFLKVLLNHKVEETEAKQLATIFTQNAADGVISHSVSRFPLMISYLDKGAIKPGTMPKLISASETIEKWDAGFGFGVTSASFCMDRAIEIASKHGVGITVALHSNHWMRPGYYGWKAADKGFIGICWTTTRKNMVPWGGAERQLGNNPLVIAVPRKKGNLVFDSSMAQYAWGKVREYAADGKKLPTVGGYDSQGNLTDDALEIEKTYKAMPAGFWKGSALSILLEAVACSLGQSSTVEDNEIYDDIETNMTQVFMAIDPKVVNENYSEDNLDRIVEGLHNCPPKDGKTPVRYPGEKALKTRMKSEKNGIEIPKRSWENLKALQ